MIDQADLLAPADRPNRRGFLGICTKGSVALVAGLATFVRQQPSALAHDRDCDLARAPQFNCSYNCWRYAGYHGYAWVSPSGHNWCFECTTGTNCWNGRFLCSEWGHM